MQVTYYNTFNRETIFLCQELGDGRNGILQHILMGLSRGILYSNRVLYIKHHCKYSWCPAVYSGGLPRAKSVSIF